MFQDSFHFTKESKNSLSTFQVFCGFFSFLFSFFPSFSFLFFLLSFHPSFLLLFDVFDREKEKESSMASLSIDDQSEKRIIYVNGKNDLQKHIICHNCLGSHLLYWLREQRQPSRSLDNENSSKFITVIMVNTADSCFSIRTRI